MSATVRVRFAPSPTGPLHIGGLRTALFNYLFAKKHQGSFILRIEDTDQKRYVNGAEEYIIKALNWCGLSLDEGPNIGGGFGPYRQSERKDIYKKYADLLLDNGHAYLAFDQPEALEQLRDNAQAKGKTFVYGPSSRIGLDNSLSLSEADVRQRLDKGEAYVIRFKIPEQETIVFKDLIRGDLQVQSAVLDDKILFKSDGMPTYHLANVVDDHLMQISHVIRGEEWLPSLALHVLLYRAFEWDAPQFAHLPLILKPEGKGKLSKRDGDKMGVPVFPMDWVDPQSGERIPGYKEQGYLPEALINMLALLGWNPGIERELFQLDELVAAFDLEKINKSGARFDPEKTRWFQQQYFFKSNPKTIADELVKLLTSEDLVAEASLVQKVVALMKERAAFTHELLELSRFFFEAPKDYDQKALQKAVKPETAAILDNVLELLEKAEPFEAEELQQNLKSFIEQQAVGFGKVMMPLRLALVGNLSGPDVFLILALLGKTESKKRLERFLNAIN
ncbi:MAG: glutamate--tRNA ligase [Flavobacteriaceae bacterium]|nr:glutamate--tRNA ligase [Flavobacteriaceae bacterium]